jgi:hypothetical protein
MTDKWDAQAIDRFEEIEEWFAYVIGEAEEESGFDSDEVLELRSAAVELRSLMLLAGPDHGLWVDEEGGLQWREPH